MPMSPRSLPNHHDDDGIMVHGLDFVDFTMRTTDLASATQQVPMEQPRLFLDG